MNKKIFIADDHNVIIMSMKVIIQNHLGNNEISTANTVEELYNITKKNTFDLYILDINMPNNDWGAMIENIRSYNSDANILIHSMHSELPFVKKAFAMGANGYITKTGSIEEIATSMKTLLAGKKYLSPSIAIEMAQEISTHGVMNGNPFDSLSKREFEVSIELIKGAEISEISKRLNVVPNTVSSFKRRIFEKLGVRNVHQLNVIAKQFGLKGINMD